MQTKSKFSVRLLMTAAMCVALGVVLPIAFHLIPGINAGKILLPMHLPVLLCGLACGPIYGLFCGVLAPVLSSLLTGMPPAAILPSMICELAVYGLLAGVFVKYFPIKRRAAGLYAALIAAMLAGRAVYGLMNALVFQAGSYTLPIFLTAAFVTALPGIVLQLVVLPPLVLLLDKAGALRRAD